MNKVLKYVPKIKFIGKRTHQLHNTHLQGSQGSKYVHKVYDNLRVKLTSEEIEIINQGGEANMNWKKIKAINI